MITSDKVMDISKTRATHERSPDAFRKGRNLHQRQAEASFLTSRNILSEINDGKGHCHDRLPMSGFSILIGGKAGYGIDKSSLVIGRLINQLGYRLYIYRDYPSLIRGGHTFSIIRASDKKVAAHFNKVDYLLALNQDTVNFHKNRLKDDSLIIYDSDLVKSEGLGLSLSKIIKEEHAPDIMRNSGIIGALCRAIGMQWKVLEDVFSHNFSNDLEINLRIARRGYNEAKEFVKITTINQDILPLLTGNETISLGLINGGLRTYISYPMTPTSPILHFMAAMAERFALKVIHPENEIAVILMALGFSYCGEKVAVGTSGGGFCLMTEGLSYSAMAELPVVVILGQRPGPSTGLPTYSSQTELLYALYAGHGEFARFLVAPGDAEEAYYWSQVALNMAWKYQTPSIILSDKTLGEGSFSFDIGLAKEIEEIVPSLWDKKAPYKRHLITESGISPLAFVPDQGAVIKVNSYEHDEFGLTTEDPEITKTMQEKRLRKERYMGQELEDYIAVNVYGDKSSVTALLCWGSTKGACVEAGTILGLKVIQPVVLAPFPLRQLKEALKGVKRLIAVENNATAQLAKLLNSFGLNADDRVLKYDGRPFSLDELLDRLREVIA
jgi:2-oxoglutarate ferredoxin oxidoreductase subunit alpha